MEKKYESIAAYIEKLVEINELKQGERLPSIRSLANEFKCNKSTVIKAYEKLEMEHRIYAIPKSGYYLVDRNNSKGKESEGIDFSEVLPDPKLLPYREFNHCINRAVEQYKDSLFLYGDTQGLKSLRETLVKHFSDYQVFTRDENIVITSGSQQALSIISRMSFSNGKEDILVEQPSYGLMQRLVELNGSRLIGITRNREGINLKELEYIFKNESIKFFYTIPRFHNPLGTSYSEKEKMRIAELAEKYDVYIVEDDYLVDSEHNRKSLPIYYYDKSDRVIYIKSFSKTFMPGIRIGAVVFPRKLTSEFLKYKRCYDINTSTLSQGALEIFINTGMYKNHIKKTRRQYKKKMEYAAGCLKGLSSGFMEYYIPQTGFFIWVRLGDSVNMDMLETRLRKKNILISPAKDFFIGNKPFENSFRLCISRLSKEELLTGFSIISEEIKKLEMS